MPVAFSRTTESSLASKGLLFHFDHVSPTQVAALREYVLKKGKKVSFTCVDHACNALKAANIQFAGGSSRPLTNETLLNNIFKHGFVGEDGKPISFKAYSSDDMTIEAHILDARRMDRSQKITVAAVGATSIVFASGLTGLSILVLQDREKENQFRRMQVLYNKLEKIGDHLSNTQKSAPTPIDEIAEFFALAPFLYGSYEGPLKSLIKFDSNIATHAHRIGLNAEVLEDPVKLHEWTWNCSESCMMFLDGLTNRFRTSLQQIYQNDPQLQDWRNGKDLLLKFLFVLNEEPERLLQ